MSEYRPPAQTKVRYFVNHSENTSNIKSWLNEPGTVTVYLTGVCKDDTPYRAFIKEILRNQLIKVISQDNGNGTLMEEATAMHAAFKQSGVIKSTKDTIARLINDISGKVYRCLEDNNLKLHTFVTLKFEYENGEAYQITKFCRERRYCIDKIEDGIYTKYHEWYY